MHSVVRRGGQTLNALFLAGSITQKKRLLIWTRAQTKHMRTARNEKYTTRIKVSK